MLARSLIRPFLSIPLTRSFLPKASFATATTMTAPNISTFTLDPSVFNSSLYSSLHSFWLSGLTKDNPNPGPEHFKRWFGGGANPEDKAALDAECYSKFGPALEAIAPEKLVLPEAKWSAKGTIDVDADLEAGVAQPFLHAIETADNDAEQAKTFLGLVLLLDQMPRNIYRKPEGLKLVYTHYDRLSHALALSQKQRLTSPSPSPPLTTVENFWTRMPLMHSEVLASHRLYSSLLHADVEAAKAEGEAAKGRVGYLENAVGAAESHSAMVERFGRYPYRNEYVGRRNTGEEEAYLNDESTESFGVAKGDAKGSGDEGRSVKGEL